MVRNGVRAAQYYLLVSASPSEVRPKQKMISVVRAYEGDSHHNASNYKKKHKENIRTPFATNGM